MGKIYRISEFSLLIGKSASTLRRWDANGRFPAKRGAGGQRFYDEDDVRQALTSQAKDTSCERAVVYCRVSSANQRNDLISQREAMERFCLARGLAVDEWVEEVGGGMNFGRKKFLRLLDDISTGRVTTVVIAHKDRLTRFGFELLEHLANRDGCKIVVANAETLSPQQELVDDLLTIIHTFSCRLYGLRRYTKELNRENLLAGNAL